ncbi:MAG TPA: hypothetical protein VLG67_03090 [Candidatus Saccharimonadales bacterium]|nr:hypothetical protein [Candidatus Saccharimonadales bacterium]
MKKIVLAVLILLIGIGVVLSQTVFKSKPVHFHAGFQVYVDDKLQSFSDFKYMDETPCTKNGKPLPDVHEDEQMEKAHLHDQIGDVVHVHRENATWGDLFKNIKYPIDGQKATAYIDGEKVDDFLTIEIEPYDSLVVFVGKHTDDKNYLKNAVKKDYIKQTEKKSETCSS